MATTREKSNKNQGDGLLTRVSSLFQRRVPTNEERKNTKRVRKKYNKPRSERVLSRPAQSEELSPPLSEALAGSIASYIKQYENSLANRCYSTALQRINSIECVQKAVKDIRARGLDNKVQFLLMMTMLIKELDIVKEDHKKGFFSFFTKSSLAKHYQYVLNKHQLDLKAMGYDIKNPQQYLNLKNYQDVHANGVKIPTAKPVR